MSARTNRIITPLMVAFVLVTTAPTFAGNIIYVDNDGPADFNNIQAAIDDSNDGETIIVAEGRYFENINFNGRNITLTSTDPCNPDVVAATIIDGNQNGSVVTFNSGEDANCVLDGFTITNGNAERGGGMYNFESSPTITNCAFTGNSAEYKGGGMWNYYSSPTVTDSSFRNNWAYDFGGGMCNEYSSPTVIDCTFSDNRSGDKGGGMNNRYDSSPTVSNCIFSCNITYESGGGMANYRSSPRIVNCTFSGNYADTDGGGMYEYGSSTTLANCIIWGNSAGEVGDQIWGGTVVNYSCVQGWTGVLGGTGNINADPLFVDTANDDYHLLSGSPCIDAGDPNYVVEPNETDLDGKPRVIGCRIDMGAYEYGQLVPSEVKIVPRTINLQSKGKWITCYIWPPEEYDVVEIDSNSILLKCEIEPEFLHVDEQEQVAIARFDREEVQSILDIGEVELTITGRLMDGTVFEATDTIKVTDKAGK